MTAKVIAPVPWFPTGHRIFGRYGQFAKVPASEIRHDIDVLHPRFPVIPKIGARLTPYFLFRAMKKSAIALKEQGYDPDVIDAHYLYPDGVAAVMLGRFLNKPVILTARGSDVTEIGQMAGYRDRIAQACNGADHIITVSNSLRHLIEKMGVTTPMTTLRNGVDLDMFPFQARPENDRFRLVFAGWLIRRKRVDLVLEAAALLEDVDVDIAGSGPEESALRGQAHRLGIADRVHFLGQKKPDEMPQLFANADTLILPSEREGWANVLLEAMATGTPVVASAVDGAVDLITDPVAGRLVTSQNGRAYAEAIQDIRRAGIERQKVHAFARGFGWQETSKGQARIFKALVPDSGNEGMLS